MAHVDVEPLSPKVEARLREAQRHLGKLRVEFPEDAELLEAERLLWAWQGRRLGFLDQRPAGEA